MKILEKYWKTTGVVLTAILFLIAAPASGSASSASSATFTIIYPDNAQAQTGKSYGEWSVAWWKYVSEIPLDSNPILDATGANCNFG